MHIDLIITFTTTCFGRQC